MKKLNNLYYLVTENLESYYQSGITTFRDNAVLTYFKYKKLKGKKNNWIFRKYIKRK